MVQGGGGGGCMRGADPELFVRGGLTLTTFFFLFLVNKWRGDPNTTKSGSS